MSRKEIRSIYPGRGVFLNGIQVNRGQTIGATSTINSENVNELGNMNIVEVIEDAASVAVQLDTNDHATITNPCLVAGINPDKTRFLTLGSFETGFCDVVAPTIKGADYGKTGVDAAAGRLTIYRTMYVEKAYVNSIELSYQTGGVATENFALESDNKTWFFNDSSNVVRAKGDIATIPTVEILVSSLTADSGVAITPDMQQLNDGSYTLGSNEDRIKKIVVVDKTQNDVTTNSGFKEVEYLYDGTYTGAPTTIADVYFTTTTKNLFKVRTGVANANTGRDTGVAIALQDIGGTSTIALVAGDKEVVMEYTASTGGNYFVPNTDYSGGLRQGQIQVYLIPTIKDVNGLEQISLGDYDIFWRIQSVSLSTPLSREQLNELGHFRPYARPITFPVEISVSVESIDSDTEMFCRLTGKNFETVAGATGTEVSIDDFLKDLNLVVKLYNYTDVQRKKIKALLESKGGKVYGWNEEESCVKENVCFLPAYGGQKTALTFENLVGGPFQVGETVTSATGSGIVSGVFQDSIVINVTTAFADGEAISGATSLATADLLAVGAIAFVYDECVKDQTGKYYFTHDLVPMKVVCSRKLNVTDEGNTLSVGSNATQSFSFKSYNWQMGLGGAAYQCKSVPTPGRFLLNDGVTDISSLDLKINTGSVNEIAGISYIDGGVAGTWQAYKYGVIAASDTCDIY